jgi:hypothetical protein
MTSETQKYLANVAKFEDQIKRALARLDHALTLLEAQTDALRAGHVPRRNGHIRPPSY